MNGSFSSDPPTVRDRRRLRAARLEVNRQLKAIDDARTAALLAAFRAELGATIRSVSPFLQSLVEIEGLSLDDLVSSIIPIPGWPRRPRLSAGGLVGREAGRHMYRYFLAALYSKGGHQHPPRDASHGTTRLLSSGAEMRVLVMGHSLEVELDMGPLRFETRFGVLRVELGYSLPETLATAVVGRLAETVVDHPALRGQRWMISALEDAAYPFVGQVLVIATGNSGYRVPWARPQAY